MNRRDELAGKISAEREKISAIVKAHVSETEYETLSSRFKSLFEHFQDTTSWASAFIQIAIDNSGYATADLLRDYGGLPTGKLPVDVIDQLDQSRWQLADLMYEFKTELNKRS